MKLKEQIFTFFFYCSSEFKFKMRGRQVTVRYLYIWQIGMTLERGCFCISFDCNLELSVTDLLHLGFDQHI